MGASHQRYKQNACVFGEMPPLFVVYYCSTSWLKRQYQSAETSRYSKLFIPLQPYNKNGNHTNENHRAIAVFNYSYIFLLMRKKIIT